jgi:predicted enzyme related to lactoylglutathione lyase
MDKVVHFEIPADDVGRAQKFYEDIFGWHANPMPEMSYTIFHTGPTNDKDGMIKEPGFINGGMMKRSEEIKTPVITINVTDIEEVAKQIEAKGGKMLKGKQPVGNMGFSAYFIDSEGNVVGLWQMT